MVEEAALTVPINTSLGADNVASRALTRLKPETLQSLTALLNECEENGKWDKAVVLVLIVLLPVAANAQ